MQGNGKLIDGTVVHTIANHEFGTQLNCWGKANIGYGFFEYDFTPESAINANRFDLILAGSSWCAEQVRGLGIKNVEVLVQGVDRGLFKPDGKPKSKQWRDYFVIYSGGKFEMRKGQDVLLAAFRVLQKRYKDVVLVNTWMNQWSDSMKSLESSPYMKYLHLDGDEVTWQERMAAIYAINRVHPARVFTHDLVSHSELVKIIRNTDIGVFPNRCEGGTNLALMEYMACGKPVIATDVTGHADVVNSDNALILKTVGKCDLKEFGHTIAAWHEPDIDDLIDKLDFAYNNRERLDEFGAKAAESMKPFTWGATAKKVVELAQNVTGGHNRPRPVSFNVRFREGLPNLFNALGYTSHGVEIGVRRGLFSESLRRGWNAGTLHLVDRWREEPGYEDMANERQVEQDKYFEEVRAKFKGKAVNIVKLESSEAAKLYPDGYFDFAYLDADHSYQAVKEDLALWYPKVRNGGIICGHDFVEDGDMYDDKGKFIGNFGVRGAVREFAVENGLKIHATDEPVWKSWWAVKP